MTIIITLAAISILISVFIAGYRCALIFSDVEQIETTVYESMERDYPETHALIFGKKS